MGERLLRPGIRTSDRIAEAIRVGGWFASTTYMFLITVADDFGRYDARTPLLRSELFPLLGDLVREADLERCLLTLEAAGLIRLYAYDGKRYLQIERWKQRMRAAKSKWPAPPAPTVAGNCHDNVVTMPSDTETDTETIINADAGDGADVPLPDSNPPKAGDGVVSIPRHPPASDPLMPTASRLIGTLNRSFAVNGRDRPKVCEMIRKFGVEQVAKAFEQCNANDALKPVAYAGTVLTNWQASSDVKTGKAAEEVEQHTPSSKLAELESAGLV